MRPNDERILHQHGDRELWYAQAEDASWQLPLFVDWRHDRERDQHFAHVMPGGICLFCSQAIALNAMFRIHDIMGAKDQWLIPRRICEAILHKAPGITPMRYYKWPASDEPPVEEKPAIRTPMSKSGLKERPTNDPIRRSFVEWLAKEHKISSSIINAVLAAVAADAPVWMIQHRKSVDLGFCKLIAVPFRANWKEIVEFKCRAIKLGDLKIRGLLALPEPERSKALEQVGLPGILTSPHNVALRRGWRNEEDVARIDYTIEAIPSQQFETAAHRIEGKRMARGPAAYVEEFEAAVEALYDQIVLALRSHLKKIIAPFADVVNGSKPGGVGFLPVLGRKIKVRDTPLTRLPVHLQPPDTSFSVFGRSDDPRLICPQAPQVPALSDIPSAHDDVRERALDGKLELLTDGEEGEPRLSLPHADGCGDPRL